MYDFHQYLIHVVTLQNFFKNAGLEYVIFNSLNPTSNLLEPTKFTELCEQADMANVLKQIDMTRVYEQQTFFTYMHDNELYYKEEGDEKYMHQMSKHTLIGQKFFSMISKIQEQEKDNEKIWEIITWPLG